MTDAAAEFAMGLANITRPRGRAFVSEMLDFHSAAAVLTSGAHYIVVILTPAELNLSVVSGHITFEELLSRARHLIVHRMPHYSLRVSCRGLEGAEEAAANRLIDELAVAEALA